MVSSTKTLFLVRHAKSSWKDPGLADQDRPLNKRGKRDASEMAGRVARRPNQPELIVASPALRAVTTAEVMAVELGLEPSTIARNDQIYDAGPAQLLDVIRSFDDRFARVMVVGHNPGLTEAVNLLAGSAIENLPTCGVVVLRFDTQSWADVRSQSAELLDLDYPKK